MVSCYMYNWVTEIEVKINMCLIVLKLTEGASE